MGSLFGEGDIYLFIYTLRRRNRRDVKMGSLFGQEDRSYTLRRRNRRDVKTGSLFGQEDRSYTLRRRKRRDVKTGSLFGQEDRSYTLRRIRSVRKIVVTLVGLFNLRESAN